MVQQPLACQDFLIVEVSWSHSDTPQWAGILWASDRPVAETSIRKHTTFIRGREISTPSAGFKSAIPASELLQTHDLERDRLNKLVWLPKIFQKSRSNLYNLFFASSMTWINSILRTKRSGAADNYRGSWRIQGPSMWDLWWTGWHLDRFVCGHLFSFRSMLQVHTHSSAIEAI